MMATWLLGILFARFSFLMQNTFLLINIIIYFYFTVAQFGENGYQY